MSHRLPLRIRRHVEHLLGQELLQPGVLVLQHLQATGLGHIHPAELGLELVEGRSRDAVLAADLRRLRTDSLLLQLPDDLFLSDPRGSHRPSP